MTAQRRAVALAAIAPRERRAEVERQCRAAAPMLIYHSQKAADLPLLLSTAPVEVAVFVPSAEVDAAAELAALVACARIPIIVAYTGARPALPESVPYFLCDLSTGLSTALRQVIDVQLAVTAREVWSVREREVLSAIVTRSKAMLTAVEAIRRVARSPRTSVLLLGETGSGKELLARTIHQLSSRAHEPFIAVDCGALPEGVIESELFGHVKGAFSGATANRAGRFELAHGGTLFLDEIGELAPTTQAKLLRALETREVWPVGGERSISVDVRVVAATHKALATMVEDGRFRRDLFFRLNVYPVEIPSLRERGPDILHLAEHFFAVFALEQSKPITGLSPNASAELMRHDFSGNVRELRNTIERAVLECAGSIIDVEHLRFASQPPRPAPPAVVPNVDLSVALSLRFGDNALDELTAAAAQAALSHAGHNLTLAARLLGVSRDRLVAIAKRHGLSVEAKPGRPRSRGQR